MNSMQRFFSRTYGIETMGLRYFNVFGKRQDPDGAYAAVIPKWFKALLNNEAIYINGDGETSRDFCYIKNAVQANILAALTENPEAVNQVYNVAFGQRTSLNGLFEILKSITSEFNAKASGNNSCLQGFPGRRCQAFTCRHKQGFRSSWIQSITRCSFRTKGSC